MGQQYNLLDDAQRRMLGGFRQAGISVVEAMIVVALIVILVLLALPTTMEWLANSRIRTASESMLAGMQLARAEAVRRNDRVEFILDGGAAWTVQTVAGALIQQRTAGEGTADVVVTPTPNTATTVTFDGLGRRRANADASNPVQQIDIDLPESILPADKTRNLRLQIGIGGQVLMCDPGVTDTTDVRICP